MADSVEIYLITSNQEIDGSTLDVATDQWSDYSENVNIAYLRPTSRNYRDIRSLVRDLDFDLIYINGIFSRFTTLIPLRLGKHLGKPILIAPHGMLHRGALSIKPFKKSVYLAFLKNVILARTSLVSWHATDQQEIADIKQHIGNSTNIYSAGNAPSFSTHLESKQKLEWGKDLRFATISLLATKKNHLFFIRVLKAIQINMPVIYDIYGPLLDTDYVDQIQKEIKNLPANVQVNIFGSIPPNEVTQKLSKYHFFVLATLGENFGNAIFEAFNVGLPVIISDQTPWKNLEEKRAGWDLPLVIEKWMDTIIKISESDQEAYSELRTGAREIAEHYMSKIDLSNQYLDMFKGIIDHAK